VPNIESAVRCFNGEGVEAVLHCGDFVAPFALLPFKKLNCGRFFAVFGNNDGEVNGINAIASGNGWTIEKMPLELELAGKRIAVIHEPDPLEKMANSGKYDLILYGHTHMQKVERVNGCTVINPGEGGGWLSGIATFAVLDLNTMDVETRIIGEKGDSLTLDG